MFLQLQPGASWPQLIRLEGLQDCSLRDIRSQKNALYPVARSLAGYILLSDICVSPSGLRQCNIPGHQTISLWETPPASQFMAQPVATWISNCKHSQFSQCTFAFSEYRNMTEVRHVVRNSQSSGRDTTRGELSFWEPTLTDHAQSQSDDITFVDAELWGLVYILVV